MSYNNGYSRKLGSALLTIMFLAIMIISFLAITSAYSSLQLSTRMIDVTLTEVSRHLQNHDPLEDGDLSPALKAYREQLKSDVTGVLDSSTVSFLFTILSLALVTAGVYLLTRSHSNLMQAESRLSAVSQQVTDMSVAIAVEEHVSLAHHSSLLLLDASTDASIASSIARLRGALTALKNMLYNAHQLEIGINPLLYRLLLDQATVIDANLSNRPEIADRLKELDITCSDCINILRESGFVERYEKRNRRLHEA